jgi:hypothetical protein
VTEIVALVSGARQLKGLASERINGELSPEAGGYQVKKIYSTVAITGRRRINPSMMKRPLSSVGTRRSPPQIASPDANETGAGHPCRRRPGSISLRGAHDNEETVRLGYAGRYAILGV